MQSRLQNATVVFDGAVVGALALFAPDAILRLQAYGVDVPGLPSG